MTKKAATEVIIAPDRIQQMVRVVRGQRVMLDFDLAKLYGVLTKRLNEQVRRNQERFPEDFAFQLTQQEVTNLMSQIATSSFDHGGRRKLPWAFTEHGVAMLSSVLRSPTAVQVNIEIMRIFVRLRRLMATPGELVEQLTQLAETVRLHDSQIKAIASVLNKLMERPAEQPHRPIGFHVHENG
ncbi:MAG: ORF6N domain-containing protein [Thermoguttaceae bacterium]